ncbi:energy transducer TonB [Thauera phenolivorans]|uniref:energy transducer TonB n=1 Tax=Thauera phenolivorans TaxID=1792543 RepID=UPI00083B6199|nr:energy transducer TonB [Thauera phenolivorans]
MRLTPARAGLGLLVLAAHLGGFAALAQLARQTERPPQVVPIQVALVQAPEPQLAAGAPETPAPLPAAQPPEPPKPAPPKPAPPKPAPPKPAPPKPAPPKPAPPKPAPPKPAPADPAPPAPAVQPAPASPVGEAPVAPASSTGAPPPPTPDRVGASAAAGPTVTAARFDAAYLRNPAPAYPPLSRRLREEGKVLLKVRVSADGSARTVEVDQSSGSERLDRAAREAVARWRFVPARRGEQPVEATVLVPIIFKLQGN